MATTMEEAKHTGWMFGIVLKGREQAKHTDAHGMDVWDCGLVVLTIHLRPQGSIGHVVTVWIRTVNQIKQTPAWSTCDFGSQSDMH